MELTELCIVYAVAAVVVLLFHWVRVPSVVGLLVAGTLVGPHGLSLIDDVERVHMLAEVGVIVLLFTVGLEFSLAQIWSMSSLMLRVGLPSFIICVLVTWLVTAGHVGGWRPGVFCGLLVAMSSTAVVLKVLSDRGETGSPHGRIIVSVLLLQDLLVVVCMLMVPLLSGAGQDVWTLTKAFGLSLVVIVLTVLIGRIAVPRVLYQVVRTRNRELFLMTVFVICIGISALTNSVGLSLAIGAFIAGLLLAESEYGYQALAEALPFRDTLSSLFFVSVGMLLDLKFVIANWPLVAGAVFALFMLKLTSVVVPTILAGYPLRTAMLAGLGAAQIGEFSFLLATRGREVGLLRDGDYQLFLAAAVVTMCITPLQIMVGPALVDFIGRLTPLQSVHDRELEDVAHSDVPRADHVIIAGYGMNGRNLAAGLADLEIPHVVLELNPETVRQRQQLGEPVLYGDVSRPAVLEHIGIMHARAYVVGISDPVSTRKTVQLARQMNPDLRILVRTRYVSEIEELRALGASEIIPEELETSVHLFARVLRLFDVPSTVVQRLATQIREGHYERFRAPGDIASHLHLTDDLLGDAVLEACHIHPRSSVAGQTILDSHFRTRTGASILAVRRTGELTTNPPATFQLLAGDVLILMGKPAAIQQAVHLLVPDATESLKRSSEISLELPGV